jgi:hypothetical protein
MTRHKTLAAAVLGVLVAATGCVTCRHSGFAESMSACGTSPVPCPVRQEVYVFALNGADVCDLCGLSALRDRLCGLGFPKVYVGSLPDCGWFQREVRRIHCADPNARFVFVGVGVSAKCVLAMGSNLAREGVPVDAVVFLDPVGVSANVSVGAPFRTVAVRSAKWPGTGLVAGENIDNPNASHFGLAGHEQTAEVVHGILVDAAANVGPLDGPPVPMLPLTDRPLPTPRPVGAMPVAVRDEWDFLKLPAGEVPPPTATVTASPPTAAKPFVPVSRGK